MELNYAHVFSLLLIAVFSAQCLHQLQLSYLRLTHPTFPVSIFALLTYSFFALGLFIQLCLYRLHDRANQRKTRMSITRVVACLVALIVCILVTYAHLRLRDHFTAIERGIVFISMFVQPTIAALATIALLSLILNHNHDIFYIFCFLSFANFLAITLCDLLGPKIKIGLAVSLLFFLMSAIFWLYRDYDAAEVLAASEMRSLLNAISPVRIEEEESQDEEAGGTEEEEAGEEAEEKEEEEKEELTTSFLFAVFGLCHVSTFQAFWFRSMSPFLQLDNWLLPFECATISSFIVLYVLGRFCDNQWTLPSGYICMAIGMSLCLGWHDSELVMSITYSVICISQLLILPSLISKLYERLDVVCNLEEEKLAIVISFPVIGCALGEFVLLEHEAYEHSTMCWVFLAYAVVAFTLSLFFQFWYTSL